MFGKRKHLSNSEKFVIQKGVDAGNLKGRGTQDKTAPKHQGSPLGLPGPLYTETRRGRTEDYSVTRRGRSS